MNVSVLIPFASTDPHRARALAHVLDTYRARRWETIVGITSGEWRKACAVQDAASRAHGDLLVVADADCICEGTPAAVEAVVDGAPWAMPHTTVRRLDPDATSAVLGGATPDRTLTLDQAPYRGISGGGIVVLPRSTWASVPLDARFHGWGQEDESWALALETLAGEPWRGRTDLFHLWHPPQERASRRIGSEQSKQLFRRYHAARTDPAAMRELIDEGRPAMDPSHLMTQTATLHHVAQDGGPDEYNDATATETTSAVRCLLQQRTRIEQTAGGQLSTQTLVLFLPADTTVDTLDYITVDGIDYQIDGPPWPAFNPRTQGVMHIEASVRRVE